MNCSSKSGVLQVAALLTLVSCSAFAQDGGSVTGTVTDATGAVLPGASIVLTVVQSSVERLATTRPDGTYRFDNLPPGSYRLRAQRDGFATFSGTPFEVGSGVSVEQNMQLQVAAVGEELVVTATRSEEQAVAVPASLSTTSMEALEARGFFVAADELRGQPGFFFRRAEGDNDDFLIVNTRGVTGNHGNDTFLALIDGIPFVGGDEEVTMGDVPYMAVDRIEMVRGPVSALYGRGGIAGALNYLTLAPRGDETRVRASLGSDTYAAGDFRFGRSAGRHQFLAAGTGLYSDGWRDHNERTVANLFAKNVGRVGTSSALTLWATYLDKDTGNGSVIPLSSRGELVPIIGGRESFVAYGDIGQRRRLFWSAARIEQPIAGAGGWSATGHYRRLRQSGRFDFYDQFGFSEADSVLTVNGFNNESTEHTGFVEGQFHWSSGPARLLAGANYERVRLNEDEFWSGQFGFTFECGFTFFAVQIDYRTGRVLNGNHPCFERELLRASSTATNEFTSTFAQLEWRLGSRATLTAGGRYDRFSRDVDITAGTPLFDNLPLSRSLDNFSPKAAVSVRYTGDHYLYGSFGEGFNSNFGPVWQWDPSLYIRREQPTTLRNFEVGAKGLFAGSVFSYALSVYAIRQRDRLLFTSNPAAATDFSAPPNIATTGQRYETEGVELSLRGRPAPGTLVDLGYGFTNATWKELLIDVGTEPIDLSGKKPVGVPRHTWSIALDQRLREGLSARIWWEYYSSYFHTQDNAFRGGAYGLLNAGVTWMPRVWSISRMTLSVTNLLDNEYYYLFGDRTRPTYAVPGVPLQARTMVDWQF
jgi:iron complex outermembrane receptor protein